MARGHADAGVVLLFGIADARRAQTYPSGPIRWLVGFTAGGTADMISRDIGSQLEKVLGASRSSSKTARAPTARPRPPRSTPPSPTGRH